MKLNYNDQYESVHSNPEFERFKRQLLRQAGGFGVFYGAESQQNRVINCYETDHHSNDSQRDSVVQNLWKSVKFSGAAVRFIGVRIHNLARSITEWYQNSNAIQRLLKLSDSALQDIGLEREQLETLRLTGGSLSSYISATRRRSFQSAENFKSESRLTLIDCSEPDRDSECKLDRAA